MAATHGFAGAREVIPDQNQGIYMGCEQQWSLVARREALCAGARLEVPPGTDGWDAGGEAAAALLQSSPPREVERLDGGRSNAEYVQHEARHDRTRR